ncbi:hypothetical protein PDG61_23650 [Mycolicibacterium sp. BiH015]|uniref:hypothetical protein n=1 Tax=Mycolicibacterium sp. BiH015 TaxID=3018808 RepID=UPI0022E02FFB|nr:hypothetical protein [Mycolicibacterium sp. BiH015]MDA2893924.1 hypothetical protein [Mycolicibacterium sp. BiH015]
MTGLRFHETMRGRIALRAFDPVDGYERVDGIAAVMHISVDIPDVRAFVRDRPHQAVMRADVVIPVLGGRFVTSKGKFICFQPGEGPNGTAVQQMLYSAELVNDDRVVEMSARKVLDPSGWRVWRDTTNLLVCLTDETPDADLERPRRAAGVVSITLWEFIRQLSTMRAYGDGGPVSKAGAVLGYVAFFVKGLVGTYFGDDGEQVSLRA